MVAVGIGANGDIMDCDDAQDRIDQMDRGHRDAGKTLKDGKGAANEP